MLTNEAYISTLLRPLESPFLVTVEACMWQRVHGQEYVRAAAMEHVEGLTLHAYSKNKSFSQPITSLSLVGMLAELAAAISEMHHHGVLHMDLKTTNIMVPCDKNTGRVTGECTGGTLAPSQTMLATVRCITCVPRYHTAGNGCSVLSPD